MSLLYWRLKDTRWTIAMDGSQCDLDVGSRACQEHKPYMHKHTQRERETRIYNLRQDTYVPGVEEREREREIY